MQLVRNDEYLTTRTSCKRYSRLLLELKRVLTLSDIDRQKDITRKVVSIFGGVFMVCGILSMLGTGWVYYSGNKSRFWPQAEALILLSEVQAYRRQSTVSTSNQLVQFKPEIQYSYIINETKYNGSRVSFSPIGGGNRSPSQWYVSRYKVGETYPVYYDGNRPERSTLVKGTSALNIAGIFAGIMFFLFGLLFYKLRNFYPNSIQ